MPTGPQVRIQPRFFGLKAQRVEPSGLDPSRLPVVQVRQRPTPPQRQGLTEHVGGPFGLAQGKQLAAPSNEPLETVGVQPFNGNRQPVTRRNRDNRRPAEDLAQPHDATGDDLGPRRRWMLTPQRLGQPLGADHLTRTDRQRRKHDPVARRQRTDIAIDGQRTQHVDSHTTHSAPTADTGQSR